MYLQSLGGSGACIQHREVTGTHPEAAALVTSSPLDTYLLTGWQSGS